MKFIHFGCWNENGCNIDKLNSPLSFVMRSLNKYVDEHNIKFIVIAGDNYYLNRQDKTKFYPNNFYSGFDCLPKNITKYLIFGNHDLKDKFKIDGKSDIYCNSVNLQYMYAEKNNSFKLFSNVLFKIHNNTIIIMIDSTLLHHITDEYIKCYVNLFPNYKLTTIDDLIKYQLNMVIDILNKNNSMTNIIFIAHHPIIALRTDKNKRINIINNKIVNFFKDIKHLLINKNVYYLCADTHLYQLGIINIDDLKIIQHIAGTGGARPDYFDDIDLTYNSNIIKYKIIKNVNKYGFLIVQIKNKIKFKFNIV